MKVVITSVTSNFGGRAGELAYLDKRRKDYSKPRWLRQQAHDSMGKILAQLEDRKLMRMRDRLIKAAQAHDEHEQAKIQQQMKAYLKEDRETGSYEQD